MTINALVIDDELLSRKRVYRLLETFKNITIVGEASNGEDAIEKINSINPDLIFLDIKMKDMTGFDVLANIKNDVHPLVIFTTAFDEFAIKAFEINAFDYLLKPFNKVRFKNSVNKAIYSIEKKNTLFYREKITTLTQHIINQNKNSFSNKFPVRLGNKIKFIEQDDIKYVLASGSYPEIQTIDHTITLRDSLSNIIKSLDENKFLRIHRSVIININFIYELIHSSYYELDVKMNDGKSFRVSKSYRKDVNIKLGLK